MAVELHQLSPSQREVFEHLARGAELIQTNPGGGAERRRYFLRTPRGRHHTVDVRTIRALRRRQLVYLEQPDRDRREWRLVPTLTGQELLRAVAE